MSLDISKLPQELLLLLLLAGACLVGLSYWDHSIRLDERQKVTKELDKVWQRRLREAEAKAQVELITIRNQHVKDYDLLRARAQRLADELRKRPSRTQQAEQPHPLTAAACPVCTGERLAREDAEFLAREAAAGHAQQLDLQQATRSYDTCRRTLEEVTKGKTNASPK